MNPTTNTNPWQSLSCDLSHYGDVYRRICLSDSHSLLWLPHQHTGRTPPPRNARWYRWYRHRRCHSPSLFLAFVQRNKPIMPGLSGAGGSWGWVSLSLIDLQTEQAIDMSEWLHDYTHCPFLGTRFGPVIHTAVAHLLLLRLLWCMCVVSLTCPLSKRVEKWFNNELEYSKLLLPWHPTLLTAQLFAIFPYFSIFPLPPFKRICTVKNRQQLHMQKTHKHTDTHTCTVTMALEFEKLLSRLMSVKKATGTTSGLVGFGPLLPMDQPIWKSKCRRRIMRL